MSSTFTPPRFCPGAMAFSSPATTRRAASASRFIRKTRVGGNRSWTMRSRVITPRRDILSMRRDTRSTRRPSISAAFRFGPSVLVVENVRAWPDDGRAASASRTMERWSTSPNPLGEGGPLVWVDRKGTEQPLPLSPRAFSNPRLSPDGTQLAVAIEDSNRQDSDLGLRSRARNRASGDRRRIQRVPRLDAGWPNAHVYVRSRRDPEPVWETRGRQRHARTSGAKRAAPVAGRVVSRREVPGCSSNRIPPTIHLSCSSGRTGSPGRNLSPRFHHGRSSRVFRPTEVGSPTKRREMSTCVAFLILLAHAKSRPGAEKSPSSRATAERFSTVYETRWWRLPSGGGWHRNLTVAENRKTAGALQEPVRRFRIQRRRFRIWREL